MGAGCSYHSLCSAPNNEMPEPSADAPPPQIALCKESIQASQCSTDADEASAQGEEAMGVAPINSKHCNLAHHRPDRLLPKSSSGSWRSLRTAAASFRSILPEHSAPLLFSPKMAVAIDAGTVDKLGIEEKDGVMAALHQSLSVGVDDDNCRRYSSTAWSSELATAASAGSRRRTSVAMHRTVSNHDTLVPAKFGDVSAASGEEARPIKDADQRNPLVLFPYDDDMNHAATNLQDAFE